MKNLFWELSRSVFIQFILNNIRKEHEESKIKERDSVEKKLKKFNEVIVKMEKESKSKDESIRQLCAKCDKLSKEPNALAKLR